MLRILAMIFPFLAQRNRGFRGRTSALAHRVGGRRGGLALGSLAAIAAPFVLRKLQARRAQRTY
jgi:hypothetical protein